jgi:hypothetical protein
MKEALLNSTKQLKAINAIIFGLSLVGGVIAFIASWTAECTDLGYYGDCYESSVSIPMLSISIASLLFSTLMFMVITVFANYAEYRAIESN